MVSSRDHGFNVEAGGKNTETPKAAVKEGRSISYPSLSVRRNPMHTPCDRSEGKIWLFDSLFLSVIFPYTLAPRARSSNLPLNGAFS